jgi:uncharacterized peroxidase-related enzyme
LRSGSGSHRKRCVPADGTLPPVSDRSFLGDPPESPPVAAVFADRLATEGYVANYARTWCWRPDLLEAFTVLRADLVDGSSLSPREIAVMVAATASARGDSYCSLAWGKKLADLSDAVTAAGVIRGTDDGLSAREAALAAWSRRVVDDPNATTTADVERLREAGFDEREIFEATTWIALRLAFSTVNDTRGTRPDGELAEHVPPQVRAAVSFGRPA